MATRTISDAGGAYNTTGAWVEGAVPTVNDDVVATATSGNLSITAAATCKSATFTNYLGMLSHSSGITWTIAGTLLLVSEMTYAPAADTCAIAITGVGNITTAGKLLGNFSVSSSGNATFLDSFTHRAVTTTLTLTQGTLNTNGQTLSIGIFNSSNSNTRTLTLGASSITCRGASTSVWNLATISNLTVTANTATIICNGAGITFAGGSKTYYDVQLTGSGMATVSGSNTFTNFTRSGTAIKTDSLVFSGSNIISGIVVFSGNSGINRIIVKSSSLGSSITLTVTGAVVSGCQNVDIMDIVFAAGGGNIDLSAITGGSGDCGGNSITGGGTLTFTSSTNWYWHVGAGNWTDYTKWYTATDGGGTQMAATAAVLPQDNVFFDVNSFDNHQHVVANTARLCNNMDWTGEDSLGAFDINMVSNIIYGSLTLVSTMTLSSSLSLSFVFEGRGNATLTTNTKSFQHMTIQKVTGKLTLMGDLTVGGTSGSGRNLIFNSGEFDANDFNVSCQTFQSNNSNTRILRMGNGIWSLTCGAATTSWNITISIGMTLYAEGSTIQTMSSNFVETFAGGGLTYNNVTVRTNTEVTTFTGSNTFNILTINYPKTVHFTEGTTTYFTDFVADGIAGNLITLDTDTSSGVFYFSCSTGTIAVSYCSIQHSAGIGGAIWDAALNCTDGGGNSGWLFTTHTYLNLRCRSWIYKRTGLYLVSRTIVKKYGYKNL